MSRTTEVETNVPERKWRRRLRHVNADNIRCAGATRSFARCSNVSVDACMVPDISCGDKEVQCRWLNLGQRLYRNFKFDYNYRRSVEIL